MSYPGPGFNFEHFETGCAPTNFKVFKVGVSALAGTRNFENFEIGGAPTKFNVFKVGVPAPAAARNFENFEIHVAPTKVKVFNVGPSARGSMLPKACPATAGPILAASHLKGYGPGEGRHGVSCF